MLRSPINESNAIAINVYGNVDRQLEWMSEDIGRAFDLQRSNPFELRNVHIMHSLEELDELGNDPKVDYTSAKQPKRRIRTTRLGETARNDTKRSALALVGAGSPRFDVGYRYTARFEGGLCSSRPLAATLLWGWQQTIISSCACAHTCFNVVHGVIYYLLTPLTRVSSRHLYQHMIPTLDSAAGGLPPCHTHVCTPLMSILYPPSPPPPDPYLLQTPQSRKTN